MLVLKIKKPSSQEEIEDIFLQIPMPKIAKVNWAKDYPYAPDVKFAIFHDGDNIYLRYEVDETHTMVKSGADNGEVWKDSCVEFFIAFDNTGYYNIEFNAIGKGLVGFRQDRNNAVHAGDDILSLISRTPTAGNEPFEEKKDMKWSLMLTIPKEVFFKHNLETLSNLNARANFYKCGDDLTTPHYISWKSIDNPTPNFHLPQFFGELDFV